MRTIYSKSALIGLLALAACDDFKNAPPPHQAPSQTAAAPATPVSPPETIPVITPPPPEQATIVVTPPPPPGSQAPQAQAIETAAAPAAGAARARPPLLIRAEVLLARAHFSPGVIDGQRGSNLTKAVVAYRQTHGLPAGGVDAALLEALTAADAAAVTQDYVITADDEKGPFLGAVPTGMTALSQLPQVGYATPLEALAEKFHMGEGLLKSLNPGADFTAVGAHIVVVRAAAEPLPAFARIEVDKAANQVRGVAADGKVLAVFPATVGSTERPAPSGDWAVKSVTPDPSYTYDPTRLTFGDASHGKLTIAPGPNNPVGAVWIALTAETYGIHGTPDPTTIGKTASHGCVRLTNWDALALGRAVHRGTPVRFMGEARKA